MERGWCLLEGLEAKLKCIIQLKGAPWDLAYLLSGRAPWVCLAAVGQEHNKATVGESAALGIAPTASENHLWHGQKSCYFLLELVLKPET